ncbi:MAG: YqgE/AlgH family protein [Pseudomonadota bacterium]|nr:YqgE/AlgH family protein [Pseudomonadota bacterium]
MSETSKNEGYLTGQLLVAMPQMLDERFSTSVIYLCAHTEDGAMGLVVNKLLENVDLPDLLKQLDLEPDLKGVGIRVHFGGPVESGRGFVLHSGDYVQDATMVINDHIALTATTDVLRDIAAGDGPQNSFFALGYAGWGPGQLDAEIQANGWLSLEADNNLVFGSDPKTVWQAALAKMGIDISMLSGDAGQA